MSKYKHILLDLDETLLDFHASEKSCFIALMKSLEITNEQELYEFFSPINKSLWKLLERKLIDKPTLFQTRFSKLLDHAASKEYITNPSGIPSVMEVNNMYFKLMSQSGIPIEGAHDFLHRLQSVDGIDLSAITNGNTITAKGRFASSNLNSRIKRLYISDEVGYDKPDIRFFDYVMKDIGDSNPDNYLVVGDSLTSDIQGANNCGMPCCLFSRTGILPDGYELLRIDQTALDYESIYNMVTNA